MELECFYIGGDVGADGGSERGAHGRDERGAAVESLGAPGGQVLWRGQPSRREVIVVVEVRVHRAQWLARASRA